MLLGMSPYQVWCIVYICGGAMFYGYDSGITTSVLAYPNFLIYMKLNATKTGAFSSAYYAASALSCLATFWLPDKLGRIRCVQIACALSLIGIALQTGAQNYNMFIVGRVFGGLAGGIVYTVCPIYASEISPPHLRGSVGSYWALIIASSYCVTEWLGLGFSFINGGQISWRVLFGLQFVPTGIMLIGSLFMPYSPRWLALKGRYDECYEVIKKLHSNNTEGNDLFWKSEYHQIRAQVEMDKAQNLGMMDLVKNKSYRRRLILICLFFLFQHLTGILPFQNFQVLIYRQIGLSSTLSLILSGVWGSVSTLSVVFFSPVLDKLGRRAAVFICYGIIIPAALMIIIAWSRWEAGGSTNKGLAKVILVGLFMTICACSGLTASFVVVYAAEILPTSIRAPGFACGTLVFNSVVILLIQVTPLALEHISWKFVILFLASDCVFIVIFYFFYPETKGKPLEEINMIFGEKIAVTLDEAAEKVDEEYRTHVTEIENSGEEVSA